MIEATSERVSQNHDDVPTATRTTNNPIAALIRQGALEAGLRQGPNRAVTKVQRMINSLQWRQAHSKDEFYPLALESGKVLQIKQLQCGEVTGLGTGATVWPAAHVLAKYLERRCGEGGLRGSRVVDLGSGTGVEGIVAAAALGAEETYLTDQEQLLFLMRENAERCCGRGAVSGSRGNTVADEHRETPQAAKNGRHPSNGGIDTNGKYKGGSDATSATDNSDDNEGAPSVHVLTYDWGMKDDQLSPPVDIILVSDCVLPKLYPIEPLVDAIDKLSGQNTTTFLSYEHRHYLAFDPRRRFEELATARGFTKTNIPQAQQHPIFSADDIEIWEVRRRPQPLSPSDGQQQAVGDNTATLTEGVTSAAVGLAGVVILRSPLGGEDVGVNSDNVGTMVTLLEERHELAQSLSGSIGSYLWPSAVVMARHLVASCCCTRPSANDSTPAAGDTSPLGDADSMSAFFRASGGFSSSYPATAKALELGSGVGLVAMTAALLGWDVVGTDKADALPLLRANLAKCLSSTKREL